MKRINSLGLIIALSATAMLLTTSCSTTSKIAKGETLYTGVKKIAYHQDSVKVVDEVKDLIFEAVNVKPNNPLYSPYYRTPLPIGLWVYNHMDPNAGGLKGWIYKTFVSRPVLISRVRPQTRVDMINTLLRQNGYFDSSAQYTLNYNNDSTKRKASITYDVTINPPYRLGEIRYTERQSTLGHLIDSIADGLSYFKTGNRYCLDSLSVVRINITNALRNMGYYYFQPEFLEFRADSLTTKGVVNMQLVKAANVPEASLRRFLSRNVLVTVDDTHTGGMPDTLEFRNCTLVKINPVKIKDNLIPSCIRSRKGRPFRVGNMDRTQLQLSRLGIFSKIDMAVVHVDSVSAEGDGFLDLRINCVVDKPIEVKVEVQGTSKSNSLIGPGLVASISNKNLLGGGEKLSADITASYEWQTGRGGHSTRGDMNSYEFGTELSFSVPRLWAPKWIDRSRRYVNWTKMALNASILNRPHYFKMARFGTRFTWEWHANKNSLNEFTPLKITYTKLISQTTKFDSVMQVNPAIKQSFQDVFIPAMQYNYTYDNSFGNDDITYSLSVMESGNIFSGIWALTGKKQGEKKLFGTPFSQFIKVQNQVVWSHRLSEQQRLVGRVFVGVAHGYGNMPDVPYSEQFYIGGANSVRAFTVRTVGPGSYTPDEINQYSYYNQTGTFKFETNWEYRFPLVGYFKGAVFLDVGNVWLLKTDEFRPGGTMKNFFDELAVGTGAGVRFDMDMLVVRADLGVGLHAPYNTGRSGYFNIALKNSLAFHLAIGYPF